MSSPSWSLAPSSSVDPPSPANTVQVIKTRLGHTITLDDTPGVARVSIAHVNGSEVSLTADGNVSITAVNDLSLTAQGNISLQASGITINAIQDFSLKAEGVSVTALEDLGLTATGAANLKADAVAVTVTSAMTIGG